MQNQPILPGSIIGVLGSGQLGRMFAIAARQMGYRVHTFSPDRDTPTGQVADVEVYGDYLDLDAVRAFARGAAVVTFEFENVPAQTAEAAASECLVRPAGSALHTTQQRLREKTFLRAHGFPVAPFAAVRTLEDLTLGLAKVGLPAVLKTADWGYDGKGQTKIERLDDARPAFEALAGAEGVLEAWMRFEREVSVVAARSATGQIAHYDVMANQHERHILDVTTSPAPIPLDVADRAVAIARGVLEALDFVGVACIELFLMPGGELAVNEVAPRPHNSGHLTIDACVTSQFEQQLRAICGLSLGSTAQHGPAAMANLLGDHWVEREPDWAALADFSDVKLHLYGKLSPRPGRKMGHLTAFGATASEAEARVRAARDALTRPRG